MNDAFSKRVSSAAAAAWWTVLVGVIWSTGSWIVWRVFAGTQAEWVRRLSGGPDWGFMNRTVLVFFAVWKLMLFLCVLTAIWLTLWGRRLRRIEAP